MIVDVVCIYKTIMYIHVLIHLTCATRQQTEANRSTAPGSPGYPDDVDFRLPYTRRHAQAVMTSRADVFNVSLLQNTAFDRNIEV